MSKIARFRVLQIPKISEGFKKKKQKITGRGVEDLISEDLIV